MLGPKRRNFRGAVGMNHRFPFSFLPRADPPSCCLLALVSPLISAPNQLADDFGNLGLYCIDAKGKLLPSFIGKPPRAKRPSSRPRYPGNEMAEAAQKKFVRDGPPRTGRQTLTHLVWPHRLYSLIALSSALFWPVHLSRRTPQAEQAGTQLPQM